MCKWGQNSRSKILIPVLFWQTDRDGAPWWVDPPLKSLGKGRVKRERDIQNHRKRVKKEL